MTIATFQLEDVAASADNRARIAIIDHTAALGGGEIALLNFVSRIDRSRFDPIVILFSAGPLSRKLAEAGVRSVLVPLSPAVNNARKDSLSGNTLLRIPEAFAALRFIRRLARVLRYEKINLVHTNSLKSDILGGLAGRLVRVPVIWHVRDRIENDYLPKFTVQVFRRLARWIPNHVIANSAATLATLRLPPDRKKFTVYSGVTLAAASRVVHDGAATHAAISDTDKKLPVAPIIGLVGRISPWKGQHIFIQAAALVLKEFPDAQFQIIGSALFGENVFDREIHQLADSLGIARSIQFLGFRSDVPQLVANFQILVHASTSGEPFGQVIVEGMVAGKPVVATDGGGVPEIVRDGETGLLVPMGDAPKMAEAICRLLRDPEMATRMGKAGLQRVQEHFSIEQTVSKIEKIYESILRRHPLDRRKPCRG